MMKGMARNPPKLSDQIRRAIETCGQTRYRIAKETGISQPTLSRFMDGSRGLPMKTLDHLAEYLGLGIVVRKKGWTDGLPPLQTDLPGRQGAAARSATARLCQQGRV